MNARKTVAWALGVLATLYLVVAVYAWTVVGLGILLPFGRQVPFPPYEWLFDAQRFSHVLVTAFVAVVLVFALRELRRHRIALALPRWSGAVVAVLLIAVATELAALVWQNFMFEPARGIAHIGRLNIFDRVEYAGIIANYVAYWSLLMLLAGAVAASKPVDGEAHGAVPTLPPT